MQRKILSRDWELLSSYVDGALSPRALGRFEARLGEDQMFADQLRLLEHTRALLRRAPNARPPRHFTLSPEMVKERSGIFSGLSLSLNAMSAVASLLLVAVLIGEILTFGPPGTTSGQTARSAEFAGESIALMAPAAAADAAESAADSAGLEESDLQSQEDFVEEPDQMDQAATETQPNFSTEATSNKEANETLGFALTRQVFRVAEILLALFAVGVMLAAKRPQSQ
ncbi:MAG: hypothetical protein O3B43_00470 [Chloroflexi bacterium]|nr:hypothetical protein [Chloroflexota bacterium]